ncbi:hypothetical protein HDU96_001701 [Phlyctochytrium bullatum]|nr:hypothetical protein HDU96_001701 [Phlyctochytrium bullatum]
MPPPTWGDGGLTSASAATKGGRSYPSNGGSRFHGIKGDRSSSTSAVAAAAAAAAEAFTPLSPRQLGSPFLANRLDPFQDSARSSRTPAAKPPPPPLPPWLESAKRHLLHRSPTISLLRQQVVNELRARLGAIGKLHPGGIAAMSTNDREELMRSVAESIRLQGGMSGEVEERRYGHTMAGVAAREAEDLWLQSVKEVDRILDERLSQVAWTAVLSRPGDLGADTTQERVRRHDFMMAHVWTHSSE